jgi:hypothetical protein
MDDFVSTFSNFEVNADMDDISNELIKIKIKKNKNHVSFIPIVVGKKYKNSKKDSISIGILDLYLSLCNEFEIYNKNDIDCDIKLAIISIFNISFSDILKIKKIKISKTAKVYLIFLKKKSAIQNTCTEKWATFFKFGSQIRKSNIVLTSSRKPKITLKLCDVLDIIH